LLARQTAARLFSAGRRLCARHGPVERGVAPRSRPLSVEGLTHARGRQDGEGSKLGVGGQQTAEAPLTKEESALACLNPARIAAGREVICKPPCSFCTETP
jgi:hypothetical protein